MWVRYDSVVTPLFCRQRLYIQQMNSTLTYFYENYFRCRRFYLVAVCNKPGLLFIDSDKFLLKSVNFYHLLMLFQIKFVFLYPKMWQSLVGEVHVGLYDNLEQRESIENKQLKGADEDSALHFNCKNWKFMDQRVS